MPSKSTPKKKTPATPAVKKPAAPKTPAKKTAAASKPVAKPAAAKKPKAHVKKQKTIRDSFNMPADDYALISAMKKRALAAGREIKKSELLRAGLKAISCMKDAAFAQAIGAVAAIKTGRPTKKRK